MQLAQTAAKSSDSTPDVTEPLEVIITNLLGLKPHTELLFICDETAFPFLPRLLDASIRQMVSPSVMYVPKSLQESSLRRCQDGEDGRIIPFILGSAIRSARAIITALSGDMDLARFRRALLNHQRDVECKLLHIPGIGAEILEVVDELAIKKIVRDAESLTSLLGNAQNIRIVTQNRTGAKSELYIKSGGWDNEPLMSPGVIYPGSWGNLPPGEVFLCPDRTSINGTICINGSIPNFLLGENDEVVLTIRDGKLLKWTGSETSKGCNFFESEKVRAAQNADENWCMIAEVGFGLNPRISQLTGNSLFDEKAQGTIHIAIGDNSVFGHAIKSNIHADLVVRNPTVFVDSDMILSCGVLRLKDMVPLTVMPALSDQSFASDTKIVLRQHAYTVNNEGTFCRRLQANSRVGILPLATGELATALLQVCTFLNEAPMTSIHKLEEIRNICKKFPIQQLLAMLYHYRIVSLKPIPVSLRS